MLAPTVYAYNPSPNVFSDLPVGWVSVCWGYVKHLQQLIAELVVKLADPGLPISTCNWTLDHTW